MPAQAKNAEKFTITYDPTRFTCQVGATQIQNGDVLLVYNEARGKEHKDFDSIKLVRSRDNGVTWDTDATVTAWPCTYHVGSDTPSIVQLSDGTLILNFFQWAFVEQRGILEDLGPQERPRATRTPDSVGLVTSTDNGHTWGEGYRANIAPMRWGQPIDEVLEMPDGTLLMACHGHLFSRAWMEVDNLHEHARSFLLRSDNRGLDWEYYSTIAYDPATIISFDETSLARTVDGTLVAMIRTMHGARNRHQHLWLTYSTNDGESWSRPEPTNLWGYPADLTPLQDGRMLCTYGYRREPYGIRGCISPDGIHWDVANEFIIASAQTAPRSAEPELYYHIGYPTTIQLADSSLLTFYHEWKTEEPIVQYVVGVRHEVIS
jgi:sialidase-1